MPEMDGYDATRQIRKQEEARDGKTKATGGKSSSSARTPIVALTASAMEGDKERCRDAGMDDHLSKPIHPAKLDAILERWCLPTSDEPENGPIILAPSKVFPFPTSGEAGKPTQPF